MITENSCSGCGLCAQICKFDAIKIEKDEEGFRYPKVNMEKCVNCNQCVIMCPANKFYNKNAEKEIIAYAGHSKRDDVLLNSTSGGTAYELARQFIKKGGVVFGVSFSQNYRSARYELICNADDLKKLCKSKYIETDRTVLFQELPKQLEEKKVLVIGLPCDIAAVKTLCGYNENLYTCKLICKSTTSEKALNQYLDTCEEEYNSKVCKFDFRHKIEGQPFFPAKVKVDFEDGRTVIQNYTATDFYKAFFILTRLDCSECVYKGATDLADITIGDFQGVTPAVSYYNKGGLSLICIHSDKGSELIETLEDFELTPVSYKEAAGYNWMMNTAIPKSPFREAFSKDFIDGGLQYACKALKENQIDILEKYKERFLNNKEVKIAIWGAGDTAHLFYEYLEMDKWTVIGVYDSSYLRIGNKFQNHIVKDIQEIGQSEADVLIGLIPSEDEMKLNNQVAELGWEKEIIHVGKYKYYR